MQPYEVDRLEVIERDPDRREWIPLRRRFGVTAFGVNAWSATGPDEPLIPEHDEGSIGHEELYLDVAGRAVFSLDSEEIDAPVGTLVFVRDPGTRRSARSGPEGATVVTVGAKPGLYDLACADALLGENDAALDHLRRAAELDGSFAEAAREDEDFASLRDDPRFPR